MDKSKTELSRDQKEILFSLVDQGCHKKEVAERVGCHWQTVYNYIRRRGED